MKEKVAKRSIASLLVLTLVLSIFMMLPVTAANVKSVTLVVPEELKGIVEFGDSDGDAFTFGDGSYDYDVLFGYTVAQNEQGDITLTASGEKTLNEITISVIELEATDADIELSLAGVSATYPSVGTGKNANGKNFTKYTVTVSSKYAGTSYSISLVADYPDTIITFPNLSNDFHVYSYDTGTGAKGETPLYGATPIEYGKAYSFKVEDYAAGSTLTVSLGNQVLTAVDGVYTIPAEKAKINNAVAISVNPQINISYPSSVAYTIEEADYSVAHNGIAKFKVTAKTGYKIDAVRVNGVIVPLGEDGFYSTGALTVAPTIIIDYSVKEYTITFTPADHISIGVESDSVTEGANYTFSVQVEAGYVVVVKANGKDLPAVNGTYTISKVTENYTITFEVTDVFSIGGVVSDYNDGNWKVGGVLESTITNYTIVAGGIIYNNADIDETIKEKAVTAILNVRSKEKVAFALDGTTAYINYLPIDDADSEVNITTKGVPADATRYACVWFVVNVNGENIVVLGDVVSLNA